MSKDERLVRDFIDAWSRNDIDELMGYFAPDCVYHNIPVEPVHGTDAIRAVIQGFAGMASRIEWIANEVAVSESGTVLTERTDRFEIGGTWVELPVMGSFEVRDGRIAAWRDYFDMAQFQRQLPKGD